MWSDSRISRRDVLKTGGGFAAAAVFAPVLAACGGSGGGSTGGDGLGTITYVSYGGPYQAAEANAWLDPFQDANPGTKIVEASPTDYGKLKSMVTAGNVEWDLVSVDADFGAGDTVRYLTPFPDSVVKAAGSRFATRYRLPYQASTSGFAYPLDTRPAPASWADFFDLDRFEGKRAFWAFTGGTAFYEGALIADGVAPADLYPLDIDRALEKWDTIKSETIFYDSPTQAVQLLASGEAAMAGTYAGRTYQANQAGIELGFMWQDAMVTYAYLVIPKGAPNAEGATELAAYITSPEHSGQIIKYYAVGAPNVNAQDIDRSAPAFEWTSSAHQDTVFEADARYYDENAETLTKRFDEWLQS